MTREIEAELNSLVADVLHGEADTRCDLEMIETGARRSALGCAAGIVETALNADHGDHAGPSLRCSCGAQARYAGRRAKLVVTAIGEIRVERSYYHCECC